MGYRWTAARTVRKFNHERAYLNRFHPARGVFKTADGGRVSEDPEVLETFGEPADWHRLRQFALRLARVVGSVLGQEKVACAINGRMTMVPPDRRAAGKLARDPGPDITKCDLTTLVLDGASRR